MQTSPWLVLGNGRKSCGMRHTKEGQEVEVENLSSPLLFLQLDQALSLFEEMAAQGVEINTVTYNSLLDVCARVGAMDRAASLLDDMLQKGEPEQRLGSLTTLHACRNETIYLESQDGGGEGAVVGAVGLM